METYIDASVGQNGVNRQVDVIVIQSRLTTLINDGLLPGLAPLTVDGQCGPKTKDAIGSFQRRFLGYQNPDKRVDKAGQTLAALFAAHLKPVPPKPPSGPSWTFSDAEKASLVRDFGHEAAAWVLKTPTAPAEAREFPATGSLAQHYTSILLWKSAQSNTQCVSDPNKRVQGILMLRNDEAYWRARARNNTEFHIRKTIATTALMDYRDYVVARKMCPGVARNRLLSIQKDLNYQMFLGFFQMMSPIGLGGAHAANSGAIAEGINKAMEWLTKQLK
ncbi:peptidoglycan-binding domain-containing protein [Thermomonas carbonis]|uniref:Peptidoglycan-binding protein n=1 Tax=Thermomonas carbonis TaxID=1463158 RepID=A0A7G9SPL8_9GAMM|nr:peptidoglycan-binding domain-containing protein [Thermomonas carbonis]QNN69793.1 peptidoglycan-binding protein [Thermomonas carbonis]GHB95536.1 hypothetical protein GCM10010080_03860 [Thermomonas carbonis]